MKNYLILAICLFTSLSTYSIELDFYKDQARLYTHKSDLNISVVKNSKWSAQSIKEHFEEAALIYAQCGVKLKISNIKTIESKHEEITFDLEGYESKDDIREAPSALNITEKNSVKNSINIFFIQSFDPTYYSIKATSVPLIRVKQEDQIPALNSVWITRIVEYEKQFSPEQGGDPKGYNVLANEIGHILLNSDHVNDYTSHNLMHKSSYSLNGRLTSKQCRDIKSSPLVKKMKLKNQCPNITSAIRSHINFEGIEKDCSSAKIIINKLDKVQDEISDLSPVHGIDFYFNNSNNNIFYKDNNLFEAALSLSYDYYGKAPLKAKQSDALWIHELGHAIFNSQLSLDWEWYGNRMLLFKEWNQAIRDNNSKKVNLVLNKIDNIPNGFKFEAFIGPYHELFADLITAVYFNDPNIMSFALAPPGDLKGKSLSKDEQNYIIQRNFMNEISLETFSQQEVHSTFAPIRKDLWELVNQKLLRGWSKKQLVRFIYKMFKNEIISLSKEMKYKEFPLAVLNNRLLKRIRK